MNRRLRCSLLSLAALLALAAHATPAAAAYTRHIRTTLTSTGPGVCSITIDSFGPPQPGPSLLAGDYKFNVPIPAASSPVNSTNLIRLALIGGLPGDYVVFTPVSTPDIVTIYRGGAGTFTMLVSDNVPTQNMAEYVVPVPGMDARGGIMLALALLLGGAWWLRSPRRRLVAR